MSEPQICPKCGRLVRYNPYFDRYICVRCHTEVPRPMSMEELASLPDEPIRADLRLEIPDPEEDGDNVGSA